MSSEQTLHAITELNQAFESFKQANDDRIKALESKKTDPIATDQVERLNTLMDQITIKMNQSKKATQRPFLGKSTNSDELEIKAFGRYLLTGDKGGLAQLETKLDTSAPEKGAVLLPNIVYEHINDAVKDVCPLMNLAHVVIMDSGTMYRYPRFKADDSDSNKSNEYLVNSDKHWGKVTDPADDKEEIKIDMVEIPLNTINYKNKISWDLLENATFDLVSWIEKGISEKVGILANKAFIDGNGGKEPKGLLKELADEEKTYKITSVKTGTNGDFKSDEEYQALLDIVCSLKARYAREASWLISSEVLKKIRMIKSPENRYLWAPADMGMGSSLALFGYPVTLCEGLPKLTENKESLFFGNFKQAYTIVHRPNMAIMRDEYTSKPDIEFLMRYGYGGRVTDGEALKALSFSA